MGWGDELIVTGQARKMQQSCPHKVVVYDRNGRIRAHEMWRDNPRIATRDERLSKTQTLKSAPGFRPYIADKHDSKWTWKDFECTPGEIYFSKEELDFAAPYSGGIMLEPNNKAQASPNKDWGLLRWIKLAELLHSLGLPLWQVGSEGTRVLPGVKLIETPTFRHGCVVLARARAAVLPEGGLHHAAAAVGVKAVVIFGGYISPKQTGYTLHTNLFTGGKPCGARQPCAHCTKAMEAITPEAVFDELTRILQ